MITESEPDASEKSAIGYRKIEAASALRRELIEYLTNPLNSGRGKELSDGLALVPFFWRYAVAILDARAEEYFARPNQSPEQFLQCLRSELVPAIVKDIFSGSWARQVETAEKMAGLPFQGREALSFPQGDSQIEAVLQDRIDNSWEKRAWSQQTETRAPGVEEQRQSVSGRESADVSAEKAPTFLGARPRILNFSGFRSNRVGR